jgi:hypothetical protein
MLGGGDGDHGPDWGDIGGLLFGYMLYREMRDGRLDPGAIWRAGCLLVVVVGVVLGGILLVVGALSPVPRYGYDQGVRGAPPTLPAVAAPVAPRTRPADTPRPTVEPSPSPSPAPKATPLPGVGDRVRFPGGWAVTVVKAGRWQPAWYHEPGWRLVTAWLRVRLPADEMACAWGDMCSLQARSGRVYPGFLDERLREPQLFACGDHHRPTTASGWVTFEVREKDAKGLVLVACPGSMFDCDGDAGEARIRLQR